MATKKRLIDANALKDEFLYLRKMWSETEIVLTINDAKTVDAVEVVHGRWEWLGPNRLVSECMCGTCSVCKVRSKYIVNTDICPNCGAKMDGDGNG